MLKARAMPLRRPVQLILPGTYDPRAARKQKFREQTRRLQDEATRAWNFHTALYYKAGGRPWRLVRDASALTTCYVGISFYHALDRSRVMTSMAEVFDERGEGLVVRGGAAKIGKDDRTAHLSAEDTEKLLTEALAEYDRVHFTRPARMAVHKTSEFSAEELQGCKNACKAAGIRVLDCVSLSRDTLVRLLRQERYPPLRGTFTQLDDRLYLLSTKGSVPFYATYPGLYVPRPLLMRCENVDTTPRQVAREILALTKMNWNDSQFDGAMPITVTAAKKVGDILKYIGKDDYFAPRYSHYM